MHTAKAAKKCSLEFNNFRYEKFILYETASYYYLVACTSEEVSYRMIKIDRGVERPSSLADILVLFSIIYILNYLVTFQFSHPSSPLSPA